MKNNNVTSVPAESEIPSGGDVGMVIAEKLRHFQRPGRKWSDSEVKIAAQIANEVINSSLPTRPEKAWHFDQYDGFTGMICRSDNSAVHALPINMQTAKAVIAAHNASSLPKQMTAEQISPSAEVKPQDQASELDKPTKL